MDGRLSDRLTEVVGPIVGTRRQRGGDFAEAFVVDLSDGNRVFAKTHKHPPEGFFTTEAAGLQWLRDADALPLPEVIAVFDDDPACLVLEWIEEGGAADEAEFGRRLAALHATDAPTFGRVDERTTGSLALPNEPCGRWAEFYSSQRLLPLARLALDRAALPATAVDRIEVIAADLERFGAAETTPARLHGDLWAGNRLVDRAGRSWLIDPAAHGGHREFDLAMMRLFGGFGPDTFAAYDEAAPLDGGWERRVHLHQLAPLIVHAIKFGGGYASAVDAALDRLA